MQTNTQVCVFKCALNQRQTSYTYWWECRHGRIKSTRKHLTNRLSSLWDHSSSNALHVLCGKLGLALFLALSKCNIQGLCHDNLSVLFSYCLGRFLRRLETHKAKSCKKCLKVRVSTQGIIYKCTQSLKYITFGVSFLIPHDLSTCDRTITLKFLSQSSIINGFFQVFDVQVNTLELIDPFHLLLLEAASKFSLTL